jgi:hypothetical protein
MASRLPGVGGRFSGTLGESDSVRMDALKQLNNCRQRFGQRLERDRRQPKRFVGPAVRAASPAALE